MDFERRPICVFTHADNIDGITFVLSQLAGFVAKHGSPEKVQLRPYAKQGYWRIRIYVVASGLVFEEEIRFQRNDTGRTEVAYDRGLCLSSFNSAYLSFVRSLRRVFGGTPSVPVFTAPEMLVECKQCGDYLPKGDEGYCDWCWQKIRLKREEAQRQAEAEAALNKGVAPFEEGLITRGFTSEVDVRDGGIQYRLDFFYPGLQLCIEIDGKEHFFATKARADRARDRWLFENRGITTIRFPKEEVAEDVEGSLAQVDRILATRLKAAA